MKLASALLLLAIIATASALYLGRRGPSAAPAEPPSAEVVRLRRELAAMQDQVATLQNNREPPAKPAPEPQESGTHSSND